MHPPLRQKLRNRSEEKPGSARVRAQRMRLWRQSLPVWVCLVAVMLGRGTAFESGQTYNVMAVGDEQTFGGFYPWPPSDPSNPESPSPAKKGEGDGYQPAMYLDHLKAIMTDKPPPVDFVGSGCRKCRGKNYIRIMPQCRSGCGGYTRKFHHLGFAKWSSSQMLSGSGPAEFRTSDASSFAEWISETAKEPDVALFYVGTYDVAQQVSPQQYAENIVKMITETRKLNAKIAFIVATSLLPNSKNPAVKAKFASLKAALEPLLGTPLNTTKSPIFTIDVSSGLDTDSYLQEFSHPPTPTFYSPDRQGAQHIARCFANVLLPLLQRLEGKQAVKLKTILEQTPAPLSAPDSPSKVPRNAGAAGVGTKAGDAASNVRGGAVVSGGHVRSGQKVHVNLSGESGTNSMVMVAAAVAAVAGLLFGASFVFRRWRAAGPRRDQKKQYELVAPDHAA